MLKILVVDDERLVRMGLTEFINEEEGFEVVGQAVDGLDAIEQVRIRQPHVVVTDIKMPKMDGRELVKYLHTNHPSIRKIVLSGFEDFTYVHDTMKNGAVDYLLKPVDEKELIGLLKRIREDIRTEEEVRINNLSLKIQLNESFSHLRDRFVFNLLSGCNSSAEEIHKKLDCFNIKTGVNRYSVVIVGINNYKFICRNEGMEEARLKSFIVRNISEELISKHAGFFSCSEGGELMAAVALTEEDESRREKMLDGLLDEIFSNLMKYTRISFTLAVGEAVEGILEIKQSYDGAAAALRSRFYSRSPAVIKFKDMKEHPFHRIDSGIFYTLIEKYESAFNNCIKTGNPGKLKALLEELCSRLKQSGIYPQEAVKLFADLHTKLELTIPEFKKSLMEICEQDYSYSKELELFDTLEDMQVYTNTLYSRVVERINSTACRKDKKLVEVVKEYVEKHYSENLTLNKIANIAYVNPNYFCEVFKNQTGENFVDYLTRVRIEKAKSLLRDISMKTYEISRLVGYESSEYFSKVFKKLVGVTPSEYRNLNG